MTYLFIMWCIALKTLLADRGKLFTALVGVVFSIVLVSLQGGLFIGLIGKAGTLVDHGEADVWAGHKNIHNVDLPCDIPRRWLDEVRAVPGVRRAEPYLIGVGEMRLPSGGFEYCSIVGVDPKHLLGNAWNLVEGNPRSILQTDGVFIDECEQAKLDNPRLGDLREIGGRARASSARPAASPAFWSCPTSSRRLTGQAGTFASRRMFARTIWCNFDPARTPRPSARPSGSACRNWTHSRGPFTAISRQATG